MFQKEHSTEKSHNLSQHHSQNFFYFSISLLFPVCLALSGFSLSGPRAGATPALPSSSSPFLCSAPFLGQVGKCRCFHGRQRPVYEEVGLQGCAIALRGRGCDGALQDDSKNSVSEVSKKKIVGRGESTKHVLRGWEIVWYPRDTTLSRVGPVLENRNDSFFLNPKMALFLLFLFLVWAEI